MQPVEGTRGVSAFAEDQERRLIPRWRFTDQTANSAEFAGDPRVKRPLALNKQFLEEKLFAWQQSRSLGNAIDLVCCGVGGRWIEEVESAAKFLDQHSDGLSNQVQTLVQNVLRPAAQIETAESIGQISLTLEPITFDLARAKVAAVRSKLRRDPRNVLGWLDLARGYTILGHRRKALTSIERALYLAPSHRHVLRSAVRLYVHVGDAEGAHILLLRNPRTPHDPWLIAAEVAVAKIAEHDPRFVRRGRKMIDSSGLPPAHLTELQSAIGTLEYYSGANRQARQRLRASLEAPTDNTVAQARWVRTQLPGIFIDESAFNLPWSFEARCWRALEEGRWEDAHFECLRWLNDEPYSSRPATVGSYIGLSLTTDHTFAKACAQAGLQAEPKDATLRNNLTVALAYEGKLEDAIKQFEKISKPLRPDLPAYVYIATGGLLQFRLGDVNGGRQSYAMAERLAPKSRKQHVAIFWAREELVAGTTEAPKHVARALASQGRPEDLGMLRLQALLKDQAHNAREQVRRQPSVERANSALPALKRQLSIGDGLQFVTPSIHTTSERRTVAMASKKDSHTGHRSSVTGRFVKESYANRCPSRTQKESIPNPGHGDTGRRKKGK